MPLLIYSRTPQPRILTHIRGRECFYDSREGTKPQYLSLTHVCCQVRAEFRPLYMRHVTFTLGDKHLKTYLDPFLPAWNSSRPATELVTNIIVSAVRFWSKDRIDVLPYLRLNALAPNVNITLDRFADDANAAILGFTLPNGVDGWPQLFANDLIYRAKFYTMAANECRRHFGFRTLNASRLRLMLIILKRSSNVVSENGSDEMRALRTILRI